MKYILLFLLLFSQSIKDKNSQNLQNHINSLSGEYQEIYSTNWTIRSSRSTEIEDYYSLQRWDADTLHLLEFAYYSKVDKYDVKTQLKLYNEHGEYHELDMDKRDTLYHFTARRDDIPLISGRILKKEDMNFLRGKYYYLYKYGRYNWKQRKYFELHQDSLIKVRGNALPELPGRLD